MEKSKEEYLSSISTIKEMMEKSTTFKFLSGYASIFTGIYALVFISFLLVKLDVSLYGSFEQFIMTVFVDQENLTFVVLVMFALLALSMLTGMGFAYNNAKKQGVKVLGKLAMRVFVNLMLPLVVGGIFCIATLFHNTFVLTLPATMVFYGLALLNASKYTHKELFSLGIFFLIFGSLSVFLIDAQILLWLASFGLLHIVYGVIMVKRQAV